MAAAPAAGCRLRVAYPTFARALGTVIARCTACTLNSHSCTRSPAIRRVSGRAIGGWWSARSLYVNSGPRGREKQPNVAKREDGARLGGVRRGVRTAGEGATSPGRWGRPTFQSSGGWRSRTWRFEHFDARRRPIGRLGRTRGSRVRGYENSRGVGLVLVP